MEINMPFPPGEEPKNEEPKDEGQQEQQEADPVELEARQHGWKPKEEFDADPKSSGKKWRTAEDFMDRKSLFDKIDQVHQENKTLKKGIKDLSQHYANVEKTAHAKALAELKAQREAALEDEDFVRAERIRDRMDEVKETMQKVQPPVAVNEPDPRVTAWKSDNTWYGKNEVMTTWADGLGNKLLAEGVHPDQVLRHVSEKVKEAFPQSFRNPNKDTAPEVVASGRRSAPNTGFRLTDMEERILTNMIKAGAPITREQYIADLKAQRGN